MDADGLIATILRHDRKTSSYKIALIRSLNDLALGYGHLGDPGSSLAIPLRALAKFWIAYYWPFVADDRPILQAVRQGDKQDISFRRSLAKLRQLWEAFIGGKSLPSDGFFLVGEFQSENRRKGYPPELQACFNQVVKDISSAIAYPIQYAGPGQYSVFDRPQKWGELKNRIPDIVCIPGTRMGERCVVLTDDLWESFKRLSLWVEALCIHQWCLFTENVSNADRGFVYKLLTARPENRRPLTWERNQVEILMMEGKLFRCPWTGRSLTTNNYDLDHILPVSLYPINELWNLIPSDPDFNRNMKRDNLPGVLTLQAAKPRLEAAYHHYVESQELLPVLRQDVTQRFDAQADLNHLPLTVVNCVTHFLEIFSQSRNIRTF